MNVTAIFAALQKEAQQRNYIRRLVVLDQTASMLKARLYISPDLFVQVYRNDLYDTTNLLLVYNEQRIYARDEIGGKWHRHPPDKPYQHDRGPEGERAIELHEFLDEVEEVLGRLQLP